MQSSRGVASIWPGYVAAVASLVLSLLLLAGVLVVAITQVGRLVGAYNDQLMMAALEDERSAMEVESLQARAKAAQPPMPAETPRARPTLANSPLAAQPDTLRPSAQGRQSIDVQTLEADIDRQAGELQRIKGELARVREERRQEVADQSAQLALRHYRFVFGPGVQGLDGAAMAQLQRRMQADGVAPDASPWVLEAGVASLDPVASREVYRLMLNTRSQLADMGFSPDQVSIVLNPRIAPHDLPGARDNLRPGDLPMLLRSQNTSRGAR